MIRIREITADAVIPLLKDADLPYSDIEPEITDFVGAYSEHRLIGAVGLQKIGEFGLLRSLVVLSDYRGKGYAKQLCDSIIKNGTQKDYKTIFLLCTDAESFFENYGFSKIEKHKAPEEVQSTKQYGEICSDSAVVMKFNIR